MRPVHVLVDKVILPVHRRLVNGLPVVLIRQHRFDAELLFEEARHALIGFVVGPDEEAVECQCPFRPFESGLFLFEFLFQNGADFPVVVDDFENGVFIDQADVRKRRIILPCRSGVRVT